MPFAGKFGFIAGIGGGYLYRHYTFSDGSAGTHSFSFEGAVGIIIWDNFEISYRIQYNYFAEIDYSEYLSVYNKLSVGYIYRFK